jgi:cytochrome b pre-mRNA-processing protein 3
MRNPLDTHKDGLMLKFLSRLTSKERPERTDAKRIYAKVMTQSRNPVFYTDDLVEDTTDGRMEWLSAHLSVVLYALHKHGENGAKLSQAIYDVMVDDFDIALREEGLSDSGVKRRIKPLAKMFLTRARSYAEALNGSDDAVGAVVQKHILQGGNNKTEASALICKYIKELSGSLGVKSLGEIAATEFEFPAF